MNNERVQNCLSRQHEQFDALPTHLVVIRAFHFTFACLVMNKWAVMVVNALPFCAAVAFSLQVFFSRIIIIEDTVLIADWVLIEPVESS